MADQSIIRVTKELSDIQKHSDLSLAVAYRDYDVRHVKALIVGPFETPYEFGFFEFSVKFSRDYPRKAPIVQAMTTNGGRCRFNPNIYASGRVCLSILGTWRGERGEEWSAAQGLESILLSIQSLMSSNPYENEPGYEDSNSPEDKKLQDSYVLKIRHEAIRVSVIQRMEEYLHIGADGAAFSTFSEGDLEEYELINCEDDPNTSFDPFRDLLKNRFLWYYESYMAAVQKGKSEVADGQSFAKMPFESPASNSMDGKFCFTILERRLRNIRKVLEAETQRWEEEGVKAKKRETTVAVNLHRQYEQIVEAFKRSDTPHDVVLVNDNPFVWRLTYFGKPMSNLDGGLFKILLRFGPKFPDEQPRVKVENKIFHHRVSPDGVLCYTQSTPKKEDVRSHLDAIIDTIEEEEPPYDPRTRVNPEAFRLYWGTPEERKIYGRKLRRSVQESVESA